MKRMLALLGVLTCLVAVFTSVGASYPSATSHWQRKSLVAPIQITVANTSKDASWNTAVLDAINVWNQAAPSTVKFTYATAKSCPSVFSKYVGICVLAYPFVNWWGYTGVNEAMLAGSMHIKSAVVSLNTTPNYAPTDQPTRNQIVAHEFGHALGLDHEFGTGTLMDYCWGCPGALAPSVGELQNIAARHNHVG